MRLILIAVVPAVMPVAAAGVNRFAYSNPDYEARLAPGKLLPAAREASH